jgi:pimeloyl-[acyl-carrier protein] methyl ester esterase
MRQRLSARKAPSAATLLEALAVLRQCDCRDEAARIGQPALVFSGDRDTLAFPLPPGSLPNACRTRGLRRFPGAAHVPFLSHADAFNAVIDEFTDG